jgi:hypothetical protein
MKSVAELVVLGTLAGFSASAAAQGWIAGAAFGQASQQDYDAGVPIATNEDTGDAMRIFGGYMISPMQGVIASFIDLGTASYGNPLPDGFSDLLDAEGYDISYVVGWAPGSQDRFTVFGTVGVFVWDQDVVSTDITGRTLYQDEGTSFSMGVGAEFMLTDTFGLHLEYQLFKEVGEAAGTLLNSGSGHELDRDVISVGVSVRFKSGYRRD